ncbi:Arc family DNA-binding protein [Burkholderia glumae]|uniref:Arc family DNA-binding protein n=1 Tax=Burkholderia glumae TaxID=337 RepID=UPI0020370222|nr:Arc family DNA-binding protein [Burkholderia glumae]MCM2493061.1 Arc family DNA-binding protein [Burkholderia glumae]
MEDIDIKAVGRDSDKFLLRLPDGMRERISASARRNGRSMNAEIVACLQLAFPDSNKMHEPSALSSLTAEQRELASEVAAEAFRAVLKELDPQGEGVLAKIARERVANWPPSPDVPTPPKHDPPANKLPRRLGTASKKAK